MRSFIAHTLFTGSTLLALLLALLSFPFAARGEDGSDGPAAVIVNPPADREIPPLHALVVVVVDEKYVTPTVRFLIFLDGTPVSARWDSLARSFSYFPRKCLLPGKHTVQVFMSEQSGEQMLVAERVFTVSGVPPPTQSLEGSVFDMRSLGRQQPVPMGAGSVEFFQLAGRTSLSASFADITGPGASLRQEPERTTVFELNGRGRSGEAAFQFRFYLTTDEDSSRQARNRCAFRVDDRGTGFEVGDTNPRLGSLTIDGMRLRGISAWGTLGALTVSFAQGEARRQTSAKTDADGNLVSYPLGERTLWIARVAAWENEPFTLGFNWLSGEEQRVTGSMSGDAGRNTVRSLDATWRFHDNSAWVQGIVAVSSFDFDDPDRPDSHGDARRVEAAWAPGDHTLRVYWQLVEPGFISLGLPSLQQDRETWGVEDRFNLGRGRLAGRLFWEQHRNNLDGKLQYATHVTQYGGQLQYRLFPWGTSLRFGYSSQSRTNNATPGEMGSIDESVASINAGLTQAFSFWGGSHTVRVDWRTSHITDLGQPSREMRQKGVTIAVSSRWTCGFSLDILCNTSTVTRPQQGMFARTDRYSVRANYQPRPQDTGVWGRWERVRQSSTSESPRSHQETLELGVRWYVSDDLTLEASITVVDHQDEADEQNNFREKLYRVILSQSLS